MKKLFLFLICLPLVLFSCKDAPEGSHPNKMDTLPHALFRIHLPNGKWSGPIIDSGIFQITSKYVFTDSTHSVGGHWVSDTLCYGRAIADTMRSADSKPLFDSAHRPLYNYGYYSIPRVYIQKVTIPIN